MNHTQSWLPETCLVSPKAAEPFERLVRKWAREWFAGQAWQVLGTWEAVTEQSDTSDWPMLHSSDRLQLRGRPAALQALAAGLVGNSAYSQKSSGDTRLLRRVAKRALDDLVVRLEEAFGPAQPTQQGYAQPRSEGYSLLLGQLGQGFVVLEVAAHDLVAITRNAFPSRLPATDLTSARAALSDHAVGVAARLGSARLTLADLENLECGDVVILDAPCRAPASLTVEGRLTDLCVGIAEQDHRIVLELQE